MIYISTSGTIHDKIKHRVKELALSGFRNIELSAGTKYYRGYEKDLCDLKREYNLDYIIHNYFPPPKNDFVINLAALNDQIFYRSLNQLRKSIQLSKKLGASKFSFHAGFYMDISLDTIGQDISKKPMYNKERSIERFCEGYNLLLKVSNDIDLFIENNVYSYQNYFKFKKEKPFMLLNSEDFHHLKTKINYNLLLDVAHLYVTSKTLKLDFQKEMRELLPLCDYIHISNNNGLYDSNNEIDTFSEIYKCIKKFDIGNKIITLEIYDGMKAIARSYNLLKKLFNKEI